MKNEKFLVYYDTEKYHSVVIRECKILGKDKWGNVKVEFDNKRGITHINNIFNTLDNALKYVGHRNKIILF